MKLTAGGKADEKGERSCLKTASPDHSKAERIRESTLYDSAAVLTKPLM